MVKIVLALVAASGIVSAAKLQAVDEAAYQKLIASNKGKVVLVNFWATWCKPCRAEMPALVKLEAQLRAKGLKLITVSADDEDKETQAEAFIAQTGVPAPAYIRKAKDDDKFINFVDPKWSGALPASILYDKNGKRVKSFIGETPMKDLEAAIQKLL